MDRFSALREEIVSILHPSFAALGIPLVEEFPAGRRQALRQSCVAAGIAGVELPASVGDAGRVRLNLRFDILCPAEAELGCHALFNRLCDSLTASSLRVGAISCGELVYDSTLRALTLTATASLEGFLRAQPSVVEGEPLREIQLCL